MTKKLSIVLVAIVAVTPLFLAGSIEAKQLTAKDIPTAYDDSLDTPGFEDLSASGNDTYVATGDEFILFQNTTASDSQVRINSVADDLGRKQDLVDTVPANSEVIVGPMERRGWVDSNGLISITAEDSITAGDIKVAIMREQND